MGFFSNLHDKGRGLAIEQDMNKTGPVVKRLRASAHNVELANLVFYTMRTSTHYAANMTTKGQKAYGLELRSLGLRYLDRYMIQGVALWLAGAFIETNVTKTQLCEQLYDFLGDLIQQIINEKDKTLDELDEIHTDELIRPS